MRAGKRVVGAVNRQAWDEYEQCFAPEVFAESRRKVVGFLREDFSPSESRRLIEGDGAMRLRLAVVAVRGERLALTRLEVGTADVSPGAPHDEFLTLGGLDGDGRIALHVAFDSDDIDAAMAELDALHAQFEHEQPKPPRLDNACVQAIRKVNAAIGREAWSEYEAMFATDVFVESRRKIVGFPEVVYSPREWTHQVKDLRGIGAESHRYVVVAVRGERLALTRLAIGTGDASPGAPQEEVLHLHGLDEDGRIALQIFFDIDDIDAAMAELDAVHAQFENEQPSAPRLDNAANRVLERYFAHFAAREWNAMAETLAGDFMTDDRRRVVNAGIRHGRDAEIANMRAFAEVGTLDITLTVVATRGERIVLVRDYLSVRDWSDSSYSGVSVIEINADNQISAHVLFDVDDFDAAVTELDARYLAGEGAAHAHTWSVITQAYAALNRHEMPAMTPIGWISTIDRLAAIESGDLSRIPPCRVGRLTAQANICIEAVYRLSHRGAVVSHAAHGISRRGRRRRVAHGRLVDGRRRPDQSLRAIR